MRLLSFQLKKVLNSNIELDAVARQHNLEGDLDDYDLILTTDQVSLETTKPVIKLEEVIDENRLRKQIDEITYSYGLNVPTEIMAQSIILNLIDDSKIILVNSDTSYNKLSKNLGQRAIEMGLADDGFTQRLLEREAQATMQFSESLAFPHTLHYKSVKPFLLLALAPDGLEDKPDLQVIICAGLPENAQDDTTLVHLYEEVVKIAERKNLISKLSKLKNYNEILNFFIIDNPIFG